MSADPTSAFDAALAAAFGTDPFAGGWSQPPLLRDDPSDFVPLVRPDSPDVPRADTGRYQFVGEIARGGMGVILKGRDPALGRDVAVKVLKVELAGRASAEQRFIEEAQVGGQLQHPGLAPVYELGRFADGRPYFTMKLVKGRTLAALLADRPDPGHDRGRFLKDFERVAQTVAYAHSKGVIHRDLKPANVMVGSFGEVQVMDWGLAKVLPQGGIADEERASRRVPPGGAGDDPSAIQTARAGAGSATQAGSVLGTPAFMPPEQAGGEIDKVDERADVFGLGAILCVVLTGHPPYVGTEPEAIRLMAIRGDLAGAFARLGGCGADPELVGLCQRCLAPESAERPRHAGEVAAAVSAYLAGVEDRARRAEVDRAAAVARETEQRKRRRVQRALAGAVLLTLAAGGVAGTWYAIDRAARLAKFDRAWDEAERLTPATEDVPPAQRLATAQAALTAARTADAQLGLGVGPSDRRDRVREVIAQLEGQERDLRLLVDLEAARLRQAEMLAEQGAFHETLAAPAYAGAFRNAGLDVLNGNLAEAAAAVRRAPLRVELAAALDDWAEAVPDRATQARLREIALQADPDSPRAQLVKLIKKNDPREIAEFVRGLDTRTLPPAVAVNLARLLGLYGMGYDVFELKITDGDARGRPPGSSPRALFQGGWHPPPGTPVVRPGTNPNLAAALLRAVHDHRPNDFWVNYTLGMMYGRTAPPRTDEQIRFLTAALAVRPDVPGVYTMLGCALLARGREAEAMTAFRKSVALNQYCFGAWTMLTQSAAPAERARYRNELEQLARDHPGDAVFQRDLGRMYYGQRRYDRAAEQFRKVTELTPGAWQPWANLGLSLEHLGRTDEAVAALREAVRLDPNQGQVLKNQVLDHLLTLLDRTGAAGEELRVFREWYDRLPADDRDRERLAPRLKYLERLADLERRLADFRGGRAEPASAGEAVMLARLCQGKKFYPDAVRFFATAFERNPVQAEHPRVVDRYNAACAAAKAAAEPGPADVRAAFRKRALDWLRADLTAPAARAKTTGERAAARQFLRETVRPDPDLAGVRSAWWLAVLPAAERAEWVKLWAEVDALEKSLAPPERAPPPRPVN